jgi:hypothetical protein
MSESDSIFAPALSALRPPVPYSFAATLSPFRPLVSPLSLLRDLVQAIRYDGVIAFPVDLIPDSDYAVDAWLAALPTSRTLVLQPQTLNWLADTLGLSLTVIRGFALLWRHAPERSASFPPRPSAHHRPGARSHTAAGAAQSD